MDTKKLFEKYRARLICEGILKAALCGLIVAFAIDAIIAAVTSFKYFMDNFKYWYLVALGAGLGVGLIVAIILYFTAFRPNTKKIARRVDKLGLEERVITMLELEKDESYIAMRQREDAKAKIKETNSKSIRFAIAKPLVVSALVVVVFGMLMTTVNVLAANDVIEPPVIGEIETVTVEYKVFNENGGRIEGKDVFFKIEKGSATTTPVCAVADDGYEFAYWMDEVGNVLGEYPERQETAVNKSMVLYAVFNLLGITDANDPTQSYDPYAYPKPEEIGDEPEPDPSQTTPDNPITEWSPNNQIKDNNTSYYGEYGPERDDAMSQLENDPNLSGKHKEGVGSYYDQLTPPEESGSESGGLN